VPSLPIPVQTSYQELLQRFGAAPSVSIEGSLVRVEKSGRGYWVARRRVGDRVTEEAIGPDTTEVLARVEAARHEQAAHRAWNERNAALVAMLRAAGALTPDQETGKVLLALSRVGFFRAGGLLSGTHAFRLYPLHLGVEAPRPEMSVTGDVDMLAPSHIRLIGPREALTARLKAAGLAFQTRFGLEEDTPSKLIVGDTVEVEILSPVARGGARTNFHEGPQEWVSALRFLEFLLIGPVRQVALYRGGVEVVIPAPERHALHKLIVAQLRQGPFRQKRENDLAQASWLLDILAVTRPYELWSAYRDMTSGGRSWTRHLTASLAEAPRAGAALARVREEFADPGEDVFPWINSPRSRG
jgi:hypothetical protein